MLVFVQAEPSKLGLPAVFVQVALKKLEQAEPLGLERGLPAFFVRAADSGHYSIESVFFPPWGARGLAADKVYSSSKKACILS